ncbi:MAG: hypothetical protein WC262_06965 [Bacteroidales bacterium]
MWWERRLQAATGKGSLGKKKKLPGLVVGATTPGCNRKGKPRQEEKASRSCGGSDDSRLQQEREASARSKKLPGLVVAVAVRCKFDMVR